MEEDELNVSCFFFRLEKYPFKHSTIQQLSINCLIADDPELISNFSCDFYRNLYSSKYCAVSSTLVFKLSEGCEIKGGA